jgi:hypothetical protein
MGDWSDPGSLDILASVHAAPGRTDEAIRTGERAAALARNNGLHDLAAQIDQHTFSYRSAPATAPGGTAQTQPQE